MMRKCILKFLTITIVLFLAMGCNSIESDAKKAASLINKSIEQTHNLQLEEAEKNYLKAKEIINKYVEKNKTAEFYEHFASHRDKENKQSAN